MDTTSLTRKELYDLVWSTPFLALSKKYNIADTDLRKVCKQMNIPLPASGHWMKLKYGKEVAIIPLLEDFEGDSTIDLSIYSNDKKEKREFDPLLVVPDKLTSPDPMILAARKSLLENKDHEGMVSTSTWDELDIRVTRNNIERALCFMDTLIKAIKTRGGKVFLKNGFTYVLVRGVEYRIFFRQKTKRVVVQGKYGNNSEYHPTNILYFKFDRWGGREWYDGTKRLEAYLPDIIARMEKSADELNEIHARNDKIREERENQERLRLELQQRKEKELSDFNEMLRKAERWHKAANLRNYIDQVEKRNLKSVEWLDWARKKADWYDPFIEAKDEMLSITDL